MAGVGKALKIVSTVGLCIAVLVALVMDLMIVHKTLGALIFFVCLMLPPVTIVAVPWYAGFSEGNWWPLILTYGVAVAAALLRVLGCHLSSSPTT